MKENNNKADIYNSSILLRYVGANRELLDDIYDLTGVYFGVFKSQLAAKGYVGITKASRGFRKRENDTRYDIVASVESGKKRVNGKFQDEINKLLEYYESTGLNEEQIKLLIKDNYSLLPVVYFGEVRSITSKCGYVPLSITEVYRTEYHMITEDMKDYLERAVLMIVLANLINEYTENFDEFILNEDLPYRKFVGDKRPLETFFDNGTFSIDPFELNKLVEKVNEVMEIMGLVRFMSGVDLNKDMISPQNTKRLTRR